MSAISTEVANPFGTMAQNQQTTGLVQVEQERATQEVQASMVIAKKFPRNQLEAMDKITKACARVTLAESALYAYPRGSQMVTGPSIRMAEALAQNWGNMQFGIRELSQANGESSVEAFAWDVETNTRQLKVFQVPHKRYTRKGIKELTDPRDIYEMVANQGARRLRACILGVIPGDVIDAAVRQCEVTLANAEGAPEEQIHKIVEAFDKYGVTQQMIIARLGHHLDSVIGAEIIQLRKIYASIRDGMASANDFFDAPDEYQQAANSEAAKLNDSIKPVAKKKAAAKKEPKPEPTKAGAPVFSYAEIADKINTATSVDAIEEALDMSNSLPKNQQEEIQVAADLKLRELEAAK